MIRRRRWSICGRYHCVVLVNPRELHYSSAEELEPQLQSMVANFDDARARQKIKEVIANFCSQGRLKEAVDFVDEQGSYNDASGYSYLLRSCGQAKALTEGRRVHLHINRSGLQSSLFIRNLLIQMYGKCGSLDDARAVFEETHYRNLFTWTMIISAYARNGHGDESLRLFHELLDDHFKADKITFITVLDSCSKPPVLEEGKLIHGHVVVNRFDTDTVVANVLLSMYARCGDLETTYRIFKSILMPDVVSWNTMITSYAQKGQGNDAFQLFSSMRVKGIKPDHFTFAGILNACTSITDLKDVYDLIISSGLESNTIVATVLVSMYAKIGNLDEALRVFGKMSEKNVVSWSAMISAYAQNGQGRMALSLFRQMKEEGFQPNKITLITTLNAIAYPEVLPDGKYLHSVIAGSNLELDVYMETTIANMYAECGSLSYACNIFDRMLKRDVVAWNTMIAAYTQHGHGDKALQLFQEMQKQGLKPNQITFIETLDACTSMLAVTEGVLLHADVINNHLDTDNIVATALLCMYSKCGNLRESRRTFDKLSNRDLVAWNATISAHVQQGDYKEALVLYKEMQSTSGLKPDKYTCADILDAYAGLAAFEEGKGFHNETIRGKFDMDVVVGTALIHMYAKCGNVADACTVFKNIRSHDRVLCNALIAAFAQHGYAEKVIETFKRMLQKGQKPDRVTFVSILSMCSHVGLVNEAWYNFLSIARDFQVMHTEDHHGCVVDLLGRVGWLDEADDFIRQMQFQAGIHVWTTFLGACHVRNNTFYANLASECIRQLDPQKASAYVVLANIYAAGDNWDNEPFPSEARTDNLSMHNNLESEQA